MGALKQAMVPRRCITKCLHCLWQSSLHNYCRIYDNLASDHGKIVMTDNLSHSLVLASSLVRVLFLASDPLKPYARVSPDGIDSEAGMSHIQSAIQLQPFQVLTISHTGCHVNINSFIKSLSPTTEGIYTSFQRQVHLHINAFPQYVLNCMIRSIVYGEHI